MSIKNVLCKTSIKTRLDTLREYLQNCKLGSLDKEDTNILKTVFDKYYVPDENQQKFGTDEIESVCVQNNPTWKNKEFLLILKNGEIWPVSIARLAGRKRTEKNKLSKAKRNLIQPDIDEFKLNNPLDVNATCEITGCKLGYDAQVDHKKPFHVICRDFDNLYEMNASCEFDIHSRNYKIRDEMYVNGFIRFHKDESELRWLSKEGNVHAHINYTQECENKVEF